MKKSFIIAVALLLGICITTASTVEVTRFGPKKYVCEKGKPQVFTNTFAADPGKGWLIVENGEQHHHQGHDEDRDHRGRDENANNRGRDEERDHRDWDDGGNHRVSSAIITLNGKKVFDPSDLNHHHHHKIPVHLLASNTLSVKVHGRPGSYLTIRVIQDIPIVVTITNPANGTTIAKSDTMVQGTITNPLGNETGVTVNGMIASVSGTQFVASHVPLQQGANTITAIATDTAGNSVSTSITVTATIPANYITITADTEMGISPLETTLRIEGSFSFAQAPVLTYAGPGDVQLIENPSPTEYRMRMTTAGIYTFMAEAKDPQNNTYTDTVTVTVLNKEEFDAMLQAKWADMKGALRVNNINGALGYFDQNQAIQEKYKDILDKLNPRMGEIVNTMLDIVFLEQSNNVAKYIITRVEDGKEFGYYIYFVRGTDGIWRIRSW
jgi:hypothetical protein